MVVCKIAMMMFSVMFALPKTCVFKIREVLFSQVNEGFTLEVSAEM